MAARGDTGGRGGLCGLLLVAFIVLRLCEVITWSWWWVMAPLWGPVVFVVVLVIIYELCEAVLDYLEG